MTCVKKISKSGLQAFVFIVPLALFCNVAMAWEFHCDLDKCGASYFVQSANQPQLQIGVILHQANLVGTHNASATPNSPASPLTFSVLFPKNTNGINQLFLSVDSNEFLQFLSPKCGKAICRQSITLEANKVGILTNGLTMRVRLHDQKNNVGLELPIYLAGIRSRLKLFRNHNASGLIASFGTSNFELHGEYSPFTGIASLILPGGSYIQTAKINDVEIKSKCATLTRRYNISFEYKSDNTDLNSMVSRYVSAYDNRYEKLKKKVISQDNTGHELLGVKPSKKLKKTTRVFQARLFREFFAASYASAGKLATEIVKHDALELTYPTQLTNNTDLLRKCGISTFAVDYLTSNSSIFAENHEDPTMEWNSINSAHIPTWYDEAYESFSTSEIPALTLINSARSPFTMVTSDIVSRKLEDEFSFVVRRRF